MMKPQSFSKDSKNTRPRAVTSLSAWFQFAALGLALSLSACGKNMHLGVTPSKDLKDPGKPTPTPTPAPVAKPDPEQEKKLAEMQKQLDEQKKNIQKGADALKAAKETLAKKEEELKNAPKADPVAIAAAQKERDEAKAKVDALEKRVTAAEVKQKEAEKKLADYQASVKPDAQPDLDGGAVNPEDAVNPTAGNGFLDINTINGHVGFAPISATDLMAEVDTRYTLGTQRADGWSIVDLKKYGQPTSLPFKNVGSNNDYDYARTLDQPRYKGIESVGLENGSITYQQDSQLLFRSAFAIPHSVDPGTEISAKLIVQGLRKATRVQSESDLKNEILCLVGGGGGSACSGSFDLTYQKTQDYLSGQSQLRSTLNENFWNPGSNPMVLNLSKMGTTILKTGKFSELTLGQKLFELESDSNQLVKEVNSPASASWVTQTGDQLEIDLFQLFDVPSNATASQKFEWIKKHSISYREAAAGYSADFSFRKMLFVMGPNLFLDEAALIISFTNKSFDEENIDSDKFANVDLIEGEAKNQDAAKAVLLTLGEDDAEGKSADSKELVKAVIRRGTVFDSVKPVAVVAPKEASFEVSQSINTTIRIPNKKLNDASKAKIKALVVELNKPENASLKIQSSIVWSANYAQTLSDQIAASLLANGLDATRILPGKVDPTGTDATKNNAISLIADKVAVADDDLDGAKLKAAAQKILTDTVGK